MPFWLRAILGRHGGAQGGMTDGSTDTILSTSLSSGYLYVLSFSLPMSRRLRIAIIGTIVAVLPMARSAAQSSQPLSKDVVAARIDSMPTQPPSGAVTAGTPR